MTLAAFFWVVMLVSLLVWGYFHRASYPLIGSGVLVFVLIATLGWKVFGPAIHG